jgi:hypothetical protein
MQCPAPNPAVRVEDLGDEVCLYRPADHLVLVLNETASQVWRLADGRTPVTDILGALADAYNAQPDDLRQDVYSALADLQERGFLIDGSVDQ